MSEETKTAQIELTEEQVKQVLETTVSVKISLIRQMANLIDVCQKRGAFQSSELEGVGGLFTTLNGAINEAGKRVAAEPEKLEPVAEGEEPKSEE